MFNVLNILIKPDHSLASRLIGVIAQIFVNHACPQPVLLLNFSQHFRLYHYLVNLLLY